MKLLVFEEPKTEIEWILTESYENDKELLQKYHIKAPTSLMECVEHTANRLNECNDLTFYSLADIQHGLIGFFGIENADEKKWLTSFAILPEYRSKEMSQAFWETVFGMEKELWCALYNKNERAIRFIEKENAEKIADATDETENNEAYQIFKLTKN